MNKKDGGEKRGIVMELAKRILEDIVNFPEELQKEVLEFI
ncbi:hypothetical protein CaldiYA01_03450 [Caldicellulosiruptor diazotrophicus]|uniref:Uncharacterized protein n=1 Tax=Caldicellulosiruptor diazotrophicus TaxID=2806205 RepID=A0ABN6E4T1_9FIRM|nr:hypothetical protein CaldiYA01_03450 [Caldicellulosiruptor diazotrophicus]